MLSEIESCFYAASNYLHILEASFTFNPQSFIKQVSLLAVGAHVTGDVATLPSLGASVYRVFLIFFLVLLNAFFVASEFAIVKVRTSKLHTLASKGKKNAKFSLRLIKDLDGYLSATQLGITFASIALGFVGEPFVNRILHFFLQDLQFLSPAVVKWFSFIIAYAVVAYLHVVLGELAPKSIAIRKSLTTTLIVSRPLAFFHWLFKPAIFILNGSANWLLKIFFRIDPARESEQGHSSEELRLLVDASGAHKEVTETEREILANALELNEHSVREVLTPRNEVIVLDSRASFEENLRIMRESRHTRFPLARGHLDSTFGLIHIKDALPLMGKKEASLTSIKRKIEIVPEMMRLDRLLRFFLDKRAHLALVVDEFGGTLGIVTLDNVIEELVGDIRDEFDSAEEAEFTRLNDDEFLVRGAFSLYDLKELAEIKELEDLDVSTVGGYFTELLGSLPKGGEKLNIAQYRVTARKSDGRRVLLLHFKRAPQELHEESRIGIQEKLSEPEEKLAKPADKLEDDTEKNKSDK